MDSAWWRYFPEGGHRWTGSCGSPARSRGIRLSKPGWRVERSGQTYVAKCSAPVGGVRWERLRDLRAEDRKY